MEFQLRDVARKPKVLIMVSRFDHCLNDLLYRVRSGSLDIEVVAVGSNHPDLRPLTQSHGIDYHPLPVTPETKPTRGAQVLALLERDQVGCAMLLRHQHVLQGELCANLSARAITLLLSFPPSLAGPAA